MSKIAFIDTGTTGRKYWKHCIHSIGIIIEIDGKLIDQREFFCAPHILAEIDPAALAHCKVTLEQIRAYPPAGEVMQELKAWLGQHVDLSDYYDRFIICGFNCNYFDIPFMQAWFAQCQDNTFDDWFWRGALDMMTIAAFYFQSVRHEFQSFGQKAIAEKLSIDFDPAKAHGALYDASICRQIYKTLNDGRS